MPEAQVIVIGGGASGMLAAGRAASLGAKVVLLEKTDRIGRKIAISGNGRCNLTNNKELTDFITVYGPNGRFLYPAFNRFFRNELLEFLHKYGVDTKVERGERIFPVSDNAGDIILALNKYLKEAGVEILTGARVSKITTQDNQLFSIVTIGGIFTARAVILATGGASYSSTGSSGDGYRLVAQLGHHITSLHPALIPLVTVEKELAKSMQGVSLKNVRLSAFNCRAEDINPAAIPANDCGENLPGRKPKPPLIESRFGEMMFTHFGIGGPVTLLTSKAVVKALATSPVSVAIDLKPALSHEKLAKRLQRDFDAYGKRSYRNLLKGLLPLKMIAPIVRLSNIPADKSASQINSQEKERLLGLLKCLRFNIKGALPLTAAIVTAGGVSLDEIEPRAMASRLVKGLYCCGELLDIDAPSGGYNLQAAFSTGYLAGESAAISVQGLDRAV